MSRATKIRESSDANGRKSITAKKTDAASQTALSVAPNHPLKEPHSHVVQFYSEGSLLLDSLARLVQQTLNDGNSAIVIATDAHRAGLRDRLEASGVARDRLMKEFRLIMLDAEASLASILADGIPNRRLLDETFKPVLRRAAAAAVGKAPHVVAFGEMVALLWTQERYEAAIRLEQLWNEFQSDESVFLYCAYPLAGFHRAKHAEDFRRICAEHSQVIRDECFTTDVREKPHAAIAASHASKPRIAAKGAPARPPGRALPARLLRAQDEEHRRIAYDLHDSTGQKLALLSMNLSSMEAEVSNSNSKLAKGLAESRKVLREISSELRGLSYSLHPPLLEELGLIAALKWFVEGFKERSGITVTVKITDAVGRLSRDIEIAIFRVIQEALTNARQHSGTATAAVRVERSGDTVTVSISDAGKGIGREELAEIDSDMALGSGFGGMRERVVNFGGQLEVLSSTHGTEIRASIPGAGRLIEPNLAGGETL